MRVDPKSVPCPSCAAPVDVRCLGGHRRIAHRIRIAVARKHAGAHLSTRLTQCLRRWGLS